MILFVFCCKKSHKSIIEVSFLADFFAFSAFSQSFALSFLYQILNFSKFRSYRSNHSLRSLEVIANSLLGWISICKAYGFNFSNFFKFFNFPICESWCRYSSWCFLWMLVGNSNDSAQNKSNNWAFVARRIGSVCPRLVQRMPKACSADAHPSVRKGSCGGHELL